MSLKRSDLEVSGNPGVSVQVREPVKRQHESHPWNFLCDFKQVTLILRACYLSKGLLWVFNREVWVICLENLNKRCQR